MKKNRTLHIGIASHAEIKKRTLAIARGRLKPQRGDPSIWFTSTTAMTRVFSEQNMALIKVIREQAPGSVRELADLAGLQRPNVVRALRQLKQYGVIEFETGSQGRKAPQLRYDVITMHLDLEAA